MSAPAPVSNELMFVTLKGGVVLPLEALQLALALEDRGATFAVDGSHLVVAGLRLTDADQVAIRKWKTHLMAIATYEAPEVV